MIARCSAWRVPPFTEDPKPKEKGFRDALALEALAGHFEAERDPCDLVFITNDDLLRRAAKERFATTEIRFFENAEDFFSHIRLIQQNQTKRFETDVQKNVAKVFDTIRVSAIERAKAEQNLDLVIPEEATRWQLAPEQSSGSWDFSTRATFVERQDNRWVWKTAFIYERVFAQKPTLPYATLLGMASGSYARQTKISLADQVNMEASFPVDSPEPSFPSTSPAVIHSSCSKVAEPRCFRTLMAFQGGPDVP